MKTGYWQELIDIILYMHLKTPILYNLWLGSVSTPLALSIVQARFVGLVHFSTGFILTYPAFIIGATSKMNEFQNPLHVCDAILFE